MAGKTPVIKLSEIPQNRHQLFWLLQLVGWTGWVTMFAIRDAYWNAPADRILLLIVDAIAHRDIPVVQTLVFLIATVLVLVNLMVDLLYGFFDPRITYN